MRILAPRATRLLVLGLLAVPLALAALFLYTLFAPVDLAARLEAVTRASVLLDRDGNQVASLYARNRVWVPLTKIPVFLRQAVVATEDNRFYRHRGVDLRGLARALYLNLRTGRLQIGRASWVERVYI